MNEGASLGIKGDEGERGHVGRESPRVSRLSAWVYLNLTQPMPRALWIGASGVGREHQSPNIFCLSSLRC